MEALLKTRTESLLVLPWLPDSQIQAAYAKPTQVQVNSQVQAAYANLP